MYQVIPTPPSEYIAYNLDMLWRILIAIPLLLFAYAIYSDVQDKLKEDDEKHSYGP